MTDRDPTGQVLRSQWFSHLRNIGDIELQRNKWLDPENSNPHWSYIEFVCSFPDDDQLEDACQKGYLTVEEQQVLAAFLPVLVGHNAPGGDDYDNAAVLNDPAWKAVVASANEAAKKLLTIVTDSDGRSALLRAPARG